MNLLPQKEKKLVQAEYHKRLAVVVLILFAATLFMVLAPMVVASIASNYEISNLSGQVDFTSRSNIAGGVDAGIKTINDLNNKLDILSQASPQDLKYSLSAIFASIATSTNVRITSFNYDQLVQKIAGASMSGHRIVLEGVAPDRSGLERFVKSLRADGRFISADLPISDLIASKDINFSITVMINNK